MIAVRRASAADAEIVAALNADVQAIHAAAMPWRFKVPGPDTFPPSEMVALLATGNFAFFIGEVEGEPAGYLFLEIQRRPATFQMFAYDMIYIHHVSVRPQFRRQGVGRALLDTAKAMARDLGMERMALDVWTFNDEARAFFDRYGLESYNERRWMRVD